ncbi:bifunctional NAD(P)H-hydrate repair enzyme [Iodidimonas gelatinilytica]|uniref:Bifunctional NAD(P)H-hydrate repair enzyme n=1 Tax=Iodidimonas gelatinilytica TaxID=1236966 RepID=A0A5A7N111_9PROT|nr:NAD(P)H-hydrate dehydratase [Iodidimonas gelatinilytica]GER01395.1 bifunctional NAD(P)H-hydrate repair enzyme [Iodidimonas gelatinilytica]
MACFNPRSDEALLSCAQMAAADRAAMSMGHFGEDLMEAAGMGVAQLALARTGIRRVLVLCGPGNNGGDGWVAARYLREAGCDVHVVFEGDVSALKGDAFTMARRYDGMTSAYDPSLLDDVDLVIDALFGAGLRGPLRGRAQQMVMDANRCNAFRLAVDVPSGLSGDTGQAEEAVFQADLTVTFFRKKPGHVLVPGRYHCGRVVVHDIGIPACVLDHIAPLAFENSPNLWRSHWPRKVPSNHKYQHGSVLVLGGRPPALGASRMTARAALRMGAGVVTLASPSDGYAIQAGALDEVMVAPYDNDSELGALMADRRRTVLAVGPGAGVGEALRRQVHLALAQKKPVVLDADALTSFEGQADALFAAIQSDVVMTPHGGEFQRVFGTQETAPDQTDGKLAITRAAAYRAGAILVHKGPDTVIAAPDGCAVIETAAPPDLATAGSGDVLAGCVAGLLAQGMPAMAAACCAVWSHGAAARNSGRGLVAGDLIAALPVISKEMELGLKSSVFR